MPVFRPFGCFLETEIMKLIEYEWDSQDIQRVMFPTCIPKDFLEKEKEHIAGFMKECFWVLKGGESELEVPFALRPTSETAMYSMFALWIRSFRDLPLKVYQTCTVFRYETKNTHPLIRVREIPFNEAHTVHETEKDALENLEQAWVGYRNVIEDKLGIYGLRIRRPDWDKFAGAEFTDVLDIIMPDGKVMQTVGAHYLGQKFAKPFQIQFNDRKQKSQFAYMTCYGVSSRILAAVVSIHGDNKGLIMPPLISYYHVVIIPILFGNKAKQKMIIEKAQEHAKMIKKAGYRVKVDDSQQSPGNKYYFWEMKGIPIRIEVGPKDIQKQQVVFVYRINGEKKEVKEEEIISEIKSGCDMTQEILSKKAKEFHEARIKVCNSIEEVKEALAFGGFAKIPFHSNGPDGKEAEAVLKEQTGAEIRGFDPKEAPPANGTKCIMTQKDAVCWAYVARAY
eukprot:Anaeramoba_ignava/a91707_85.p1 GENE.a91707_85~~a91707_85.p1  ORF type:complete len:451 (-),score=145.86 a91707_85:413-1765(-)